MFAPAKKQNPIQAIHTNASEPISEI